MSALRSGTTERQLEEGQAGAAYGGASVDRLSHFPPNPQGADEKPTTDHKWHHMRRNRKKQKLEAKLPGVMQGAEDVEDAAKRLSIKNEIVAAMGEFIGTFLFLFFALGIASVAGQSQLTANSAQQVQSTAGNAQSSSIDPSQLLYSSLGFAFSLAVNVWAFFRVSGGLFNPAVALALFLTKSLTWYRFIILFTIEFIAGIAAAGMAAVLFPGGLNARTKLAASTSIAQGFFIEMFMTAQLVFAVFMLAGEKHKGTFLAPVGIGLALFIAELWATPFTGGSLNPARSLGPSVIAAQFESTTWIYYTAPFVGALLATAIYSVLKYFNYETAVAGQDDSGEELILRDANGQVTGFVDQIDTEEVEETGLRPTASHESLSSTVNGGGGATAVGSGSPKKTESAMPGVGAKGKSSVDGTNALSASSSADAEKNAIRAQDHA